MKNDKTSKKPNAHKTKTLPKGIIIALILILAIFAAAVGTVGYYTRGFKTFAKTYIEVNDEIYTDGAITLPLEGVVRFNVDGASWKDENFVTTITPNAENGFIYKFDGLLKNYADVGDLTEFFDIKTEKDYFEINCTVNYSLKNILDKYHGGEVELPEIEQKAFYYVLNITRGKNKISLYLRQDTAAKKVEIDRNHVAF